MHENGKQPKNACTVLELPRVKGNPDQHYPGYDFEDRVFGEIARFADPKTILTGPNATNALLGISYIGMLAKPDAIGFLPISATCWMLSDFFEIKAGKDLGIAPKLRGFYELLGALREDPMYLVDAFKTVSGICKTLPKGIVIPPDEDIFVNFYGPYCQNKEPRNDSAFQQRYITFPDPPVTLFQHNK